jgi:hypothetical protein
MSTTRKPTKKYIVSPATAEQISQGVGVTPEDRAIVTKVLTDLGYIGKKPVKASNSETRKPSPKSDER